MEPAESEGSVRSERTRSSIISTTSSKARRATGVSSRSLRSQRSSFMSTDTSYEGSAFHDPSIGTESGKVHDLSEIVSEESQGSELDDAQFFNSKDIKHYILTEKAKMHIKPHLPGACRDYKIMLREENDFKNEPEWDSSEHCVIRDLIESKQTSTLAYELLNRKREEHTQTRVERDRQIEELKNEEQLFGASFIFFDKFVKENVEKRERAYEKIKSEKFIKANLEDQILQAQNKIEKLREIKNDMVERIADRKGFVDFLENVRGLAQSEFGNGVHEIAERFELLLMVREELANEQAEAVKHMQELSNKMFKITDEQIEEMINLRNKVTKLYGRYDAAKHDALQWESIVNNVEEMTAKQSRQLMRVKNALWDLYSQICEHLELPITLERHEIQKQLGVIENTILLLRRALFLIKKKKAKQIIFSRPSAVIIQESKHSIKKRST